jgi:hypothetical protein
MRRGVTIVACVGVEERDREDEVISSVECEEVEGVEVDEGEGNVGCAVDSRVVIEIS